MFVVSTVFIFNADDSPVNSSDVFNIAGVGASPKATIPADIDPHAVCENLC